MKAKNKVDSEDNILLKTLFNYIVPFLNNKYTSTDLKQRNSANLRIGGMSSAQKPHINRWNSERQKPRNVIANEIMPPICDGLNLFKPTNISEYGWFLTDEKQENSLESKLKKIEFNDILFLEQLILNNIKKSNKITIKKEIKPKELDFLDFLVNNETGEALKSREIKYSLEITNKKIGSEEKGYSVSIRYEETDSEEKLDVSIRFDNYGLDRLNPLNKINNEKLKDNKKNQYSFSIINKKDNKNSGNYSVKIAYDSNYEEERLAISYKSTIGAYLNKRQESLHDFTDRVPGKFVNIFPESVMGGILGFTYLGENFMGLRADLTGSLKKMVDIHESIHTPDEYETRILTDWIMSREKARYIR